MWIMEVVDYNEINVGQSPLDLGSSPDKLIAKFLASILTLWGLSSFFHKKRKLEGNIQISRNFSTAQT